MLLRHWEKSALPGRTPYDLWRDDRDIFELYQATQSFDNRVKLSRAAYWASFVRTPAGETMFAGLYAAKHIGPLIEDRPIPHRHGVDVAGSCDHYELLPDSRLRELEGRLFVNWGEGTRAWIQRAERQNKPIVEVRTAFKEAEFPGFLAFMEPLSRIAALPKGWIEILKHASGVYLLTCPASKEQYVGSAYGAEGFWHRWMNYVATGHGDNIALKSRDPSDYQVSILEVAGSGASFEDIINLEARWKRKLQSREMGLNRN